MMHAGEVTTDVDQVRRLVATQFPDWAGRTISPLPVGGTDHSLYRLGDDLLLRLPRIEWAADQAERDHRWLPVLAPHLPLSVPVPVAVGQPGEGFAWRWSVVPWLDGENPTSESLDLGAAAEQLAGFLAALRGVDPTGGPVKDGTGRGVPLAALDEQTRAAIAASGERVDQARVTSAWNQALAARPWTAPGVWLHGDLTAGNLLARHRRLSAVIDFGPLGVGDPAVDLMPAWSLFDRASRRTFRTAVGADDDAWLRGRGWALSTALGALPYYWDTFPAIVAEALHKIEQLLDDPE